ncbi:class I SAM-dependent methyltransferase [Roseibium sp. RKSG952]|nr:class I SAM-dependent methyltransferase [Roseibium sp. RKSG952]
MMHVFAGTCPICEQPSKFRSEHDWLRDFLLCSNCGSLPRERALAWCLHHFIPDWRSMVIHECSPAERGISVRMMKEAPGYIGSHYYSDVPRGQKNGPYQSENLEQLTFEDNSIDIHCHLDVLEHVNDPGACFTEMMRTLKPGGFIIFTTPVYETKATTERRAWIREDGVEHLFEPEYHGNPIDNEGAAVTFHFGNDLSSLILNWAPGASVRQVRLNDASIGVLGEFRDVFVVQKPDPNPPGIVTRVRNWLR